MKVEVRCCCDPDRLIGHVMIADSRVHPGPIVFPLTTEIGLIGPRESKETPFVSVELKIGRVGYGTRSWLAVCSNDVPIETLRRLPTFREAT